MRHARDALREDEREFLVVVGPAPGELAGLDHEDATPLGGAVERPGLRMEVRTEQPGDSPVVHLIVRRRTDDRTCHIYRTGFYGHKRWTKPDGSPVVHDGAVDGPDGSPPPAARPSQFCRR
jgi:hypothetical protein